MQDDSKSVLKKDIPNMEQEDLKDLELITLPEPEGEDPSKTGPKGKRLKAVEVEGYWVGRGVSRKFVTPDDVYKLAAIGSTNTEIARWFGIEEQTLRYNFSEILAKGREDVKQSLRMAQLKLALSGNAVMLIWLGKNLLGQTDQVQNTTSNQPLPWSDEE